MKTSKITFLFLVLAGVSGASIIAKADACMDKYIQCSSTCSSVYADSYDTCIKRCDVDDVRCTKDAVEAERERLRQEQARTRDLARDTDNQRRSEQARETGKFYCQAEYDSCLGSCTGSSGFSNATCVTSCNSRFGNCASITEVRYEDNRSREETNNYDNRVDNTRYDDTRYDDHREPTRVDDSSSSAEVERERQRLKDEQDRLERERRIEEERQARIREEQRRIAEEAERQRIREHNRVCETQHRSCVSGCTGPDANSNFLCVNICNSNYNSCIR